MYFAWLMLTVIVSGTANAQDANELNKLRLAQSLEQAGEFAQALPFYQQLYKAHPDNFVYFDGLRRTYISLREFPEAAELIRSRLKSNPNDVVLLSQLGDLYYKEGKLDSANATWNSALAVNPKDMNAYRFVAQMMVEDDLYDRAVEVYKEGERKTGSKTAFVTEIAHVYFLTMNYRGSIVELLQLLDSKRDEASYVYIESQIAGYSSSKEAMDAFIEEMSLEVKDHTDNVDYHRLLAFLYMEEKNYPAAYGIYSWLDNHLSSGGAELLSFADRAFNDGSYKPAADAYREVSETAKDRSIIAKALMGYAYSLRKMGTHDYSEDDLPCSTTDSLKELNASLATFLDVVNDYGNSQYAGPAAMNSIEIEMDYFHNFPLAERFLSQYRQLLLPFGNAVPVLRARLYIMEGNLKAALSEALTTLEITKAEADPYYDRLQFEAALSLYYMGLFDSSSYYLKKISEDPSSDAANDAIRLNDLIDDNKGNPDALKEYASAQAMEISDRVPQAAATLESILKSYPQVPLAANARFDLASEFCRMGNVKAALQNYSELAADSLGIFADHAQLRICVIYEKTLHDKAKAISEYESFLSRFPNSIYQNRVREMLQGLLGPNS